MQVIPQFIALVAITFFMSNANAMGWTNKEEVRDAFKVCFKEQGIEKPKKGEDRKKVDKEKLHACVVKHGISEETLKELKEKRKAFRVAKKACKEVSGDDRDKVRACLKEKGFERPGRKHEEKT